MKDLLYKAVEFATEAHKEQTRKYTGEPYIFHPLEVAQIVANVLPNDLEAQAAAVLHDTVEDTDATLEQIEELFGERVADLVNKVTKVTEPGNSAGARPRAVRKELDRQHYASGCAASQTIKLADVLSNTADVVDHDPKFAKVYLVEQADLVASLTKGHKTLFDAANTAVANAKDALSEL